MLYWQNTIPDQRMWREKNSTQAVFEAIDMLFGLVKIASLSVTVSDYIAPEISVYFALPLTFFLADQWSRKKYAKKTDHEVVHGFFTTLVTIASIAILFDLYLRQFSVDKKSVNLFVATFSFSRILSFNVAHHAFTYEENPELTPETGKLSATEMRKQDQYFCAKIISAGAEFLYHGAMFYCLEIFLKESSNSTFCFALKFMNQAMSVGLLTENWLYEVGLVNTKIYLPFWSSSRMEPLDNMINNLLSNSSPHSD